MDSWLQQAFRMFTETPEQLSADYERRKLGKDLVAGLEVSTCWTDDFGFETAISDERGTYPVERYGSREKALEGHAKWMKEAETVEVVTELGTGDGLVDDRQVTLRRNPDETEQGGKADE